jgi:maltose alpha-D-glucosyltransferase / alpha-amylase
LRKSEEAMPRRTYEPLTDDPLWYKDAVIFELHVRAYHDSNGDGIGDFRGLVQKLDYLQDLGVNALWLLPFYPSPLKDDGYDIADYTSVNPSYGTLDDFKEFLQEAHRRGLRVITELVLNHTSDQHSWFRRARKAPPGSRERAFYVWSDSSDRYKDARIIFKDFEPSNWSWDPVARAYYWHRFYHHQPDLNFENPEVKQALLGVVDFWFGLGVDGLRLDAVPYLYEREGTNCENLPETHGFLKELRRHVDEKFRGKMLLAEANQWPEDSVTYFGAGDECHMAFHFPIMPRLFMSVRMEDRYPLLDILEQTPPIPESCQWAIFLRNHDELTLEMVTDEERDYMYRVYAHDPQMRINLGIRRRLAALLGNDRRQIELLKGLLFSLPGTPVLYYGDEIGMGDNIYLGDRNGVRTPMQWSPDRNAGFSRANPQRLFFPVISDPQFHFEAVNVEAQQQNPSSLLWWMKRLIAVRRHSLALGRGALKMLTPENRKVLAFIREHPNERILVVANLSRSIQPVELDLSGYQGLIPYEVLGGTPMPKIESRPYLLTLGPFAFYWFRLQATEATPEVPAGEPTTIEIRDDWRWLFGEGRARLVTLLRRAMPSRRWFFGRARNPKSLQLSATVDIPCPGGPVTLALIGVEYAEGDPDTYTVPLVQATKEEGERVLREQPAFVWAKLVQGTNESYLLDGFARPELASVLYEIARGQRTIGGDGASIAGFANGPLAPRAEGDPPPLLIKGEHRHVASQLGEAHILKMFRLVEPGESPEVEIGRALTAMRHPNVSCMFGGLDVIWDDARRGTLGLLFGYVANEGSAWSYTTDAIQLYFQRALAQRDRPPAPQPLFELVSRPPTDLEHELIGDYLESARLIGTRTAEIHLALAAIDDPAFAPEPFSTLYQRSIYQHARSVTGTTIDLIAKKRRALPENARALAERVTSLGTKFEERYRAVLKQKIDVSRIRCHGDYHLGQLLFTGKDFVAIDFEGIPTIPVSTRRIKRSALRDVAAMIRSFHYAAMQIFCDAHARGSLREEDLPVLDPWANLWHRRVSASFLRGYFERAGDAPFVPKLEDERRALLEMYLLEKAMLEIESELNYRPEWVRIPLQGVLQYLEEPT